MGRLRLAFDRCCCAPDLYDALPERQPALMYMRNRLSVIRVLVTQLVRGQGVMPERLGRLAPIAGSRVSQGTRSCAVALHSDTGRVQSQRGPHAIICDPLRRRTR
jgi:hypothetical protein